jgi:hypothetical protein
MFPRSMAKSSNDWFETKSTDEIRVSAWYGRSELKLLQELYTDNPTSYSIVEAANGKKDLFIEGIFMQTNLRNKNGRVYPKTMMEQKVADYISEYIQTNRAMGELEHPATPQINLDRVSHIITDLRFEGNDIIGRAKILDTPCGNIARGLIEGGVQLGVSSRGVGSISSRGGINEVQDDFRLATVDLVANPSAKSALVQGIYEGAEWVYENGIWQQSMIEEAKTQIDKLYTEDVALQIFQKFMASLRA